VDTLFGRCTMCGRCTLNCVAGVNVPALVRAGRGALVSAALVPSDLQSTVDLAVRSGNSMGIPREEWIATVEWLEEELRAEVGDASARLPLDEAGADILYTVNPREAKFFPMSIVAAGAIFHMAGARWTLSSDAYDLTNYGLFSGDDESAGVMAGRLLDAARALGVRTLVIGECGHGFVSNRWWGAQWRREAQPLEIRSVLELVRDYLASGRVSVDPARCDARVTLHDPCNLVRLGGLAEEPRFILDRAAPGWVEMSPNREQNFCCGGGGGQLGMSRFAKRRLAAGRVKADQIRRTGATVVAAPCHNCIDQLSELNKEYTLGVSIKTVCEIVADVLVTPARPRH
jgi:Fe-S oxidoreductase